MAKFKKGEKLRVVAGSFKGDTATFVKYVIGGLSVRVVLDSDGKSHTIRIASVASMVTKKDTKAKVPLPPKTTSTSPAALQHRLDRVQELLQEVNKEFDLLASAFKELQM